MVSVEDKSLPDTSGSVRGQLIVSGWKLYNVEEGIGITYVNQVDLAGYIPGAFLKKLLLQIPLCAGKVRDYIIQHGFVPTTTLHHVEFQGESFDHDERKYSLQLTATSKSGSVHILCSQRMYPQGIQIQLEGQAEIVQSVDSFQNPIIELSHIQGSIQFYITKK